MLVYKKFHKDYEWSNKPSGDEIRNNVQISYLLFLLVDALEDKEDWREKAENIIKEEMVEQSE